MEALKYDDLKDGMELEYEDFWHSGILSWKKGVVEIYDGGNSIVKSVVFKAEKEGRIIFPHRMYQVQLPKRTF